MKNIVVFSGGRSEEHEISLVTANSLLSVLNETKKYNVYHVTISKEGNIWQESDQPVNFDIHGTLHLKAKKIKVDFAIPAFHGHPGETGDFQSLLSLAGVPYLGCHSEAHQICFNKINTRLWMDRLDIPNAPYEFVTNASEQSCHKALSFFNTHKDIFIKASHQGSSRGCYHVTEEGQVIKAVKDALTFSPSVILEKTIHGRELEIAAYRLNGELFITKPGEILCPGGFYDYDQKYHQSSKAQTIVTASNVSTTQLEQLKIYVARFFNELKLRHLARVDFFMDEHNIYLNEVNTFPGMTKISLFPKMLEANNHSFSDFLISTIESEIKNE